MKSISFSFKHWLVLYLKAYATIMMGIRPAEAQPSFEIQRGICTQAGFYILPANKLNEHTAVDLMDNGQIAITGPAVDGQQFIMARKQVNEQRNKLDPILDKEGERIQNILLKAYETCIYSGKIKPEDRASFDKLSQIKEAMQWKYNTYIAAKEVLRKKQYGNCGEYASVTAAQYLTAQLMGYDVGTIQRFLLSLDGNNSKSNHGFVVINSGVPAQHIENNAGAVAEKLEYIDKQPDSYLCDHGYNHAEGSFSQVRMNNPFYGKGISRPWSTLRIFDINMYTSSYGLDVKATEVIQAIRKFDDELNEKIKNDIPLPEGFEKKFRLRK